jgi:type III restriction enzyme
MITLKDYQERVLDTLRNYMRATSRTGDPSMAFREYQRGFGARINQYFPVQAAGLSLSMPYVCLRVPTGGGKTLLACHAAGIAQSELLQAECSVVLWLVPSNTILDQTVDALRDKRHAYCRALEMACGPVSVYGIGEALNLSRAAMVGQTVVIVSTIQSFRVEDTTGRKVYEQAGVFDEHLQNVPADRIADLEPGSDGKPKRSLANVLRLHRPTVIVDEAHNARSDLSFTTLGQVMPSCIIEFTATPDRKKHPSNVLHHVSAAELKAADMVKLPLRVITRHPSQKDQLLSEALTLRGSLEKLATLEGQETNEYLRPILLVQAENVAACEPWRERIITEFTDFGLTKEEVRISVGALDELKTEKAISTPKSKVRVIITVEKLREGWDCPFAYVLCSLKETRSATAIEQLVGRILRLPNATPKRHPDLNCAFALSLSNSMPEVLNELREALESNGFTRAEAERIIIPTSSGITLGQQPESVKLDLVSEIDVPRTEAVVKKLGGKVRFNPAMGEITVMVPLNTEETADLKSCATTDQAKTALNEAAERVKEADQAFGGSGETRPPSPYQLQLPFRMPILCVKEGDHYFEFESTHLLEHPWNLSQKDASLAASYDPTKQPQARSGTIDIDKDSQVKLTNEPSGTYDFVHRLHKQVSALSNQVSMTVEQLVVWLDRRIDHQDIPYAESAAFLNKVVRGLMAKHGIEDVSVLALDRFRLCDEIEAAIDRHRVSERMHAFQGFLLPSSELAVDDSQMLDFSTVNYEPSWLYAGGHVFHKHYFGPKPGELEERSAQSRELKEEFKCACWLDSHPKVKYWFRNLERRRKSFRLQTSSDFFYPDFVCMLEDGRTLVVEYKGGHLYNNDDSKEKRAVGEVWAARTKGTGLFSMPSSDDFSEIEAKMV